MDQIKRALKSSLQRRGWFLRKTAGLPAGVDLFADLDRFGIAPRCIFDVGAHEGETAIAYAEAFPGAAIFAFEPVARNFAALSATAKGRAITPIHAALGESVGDMAICVHPTNTQASSLAPTRQIGPLERVHVDTIDNFAAQRNLAPDLIKIDVEGYELEVLRGAHRTLARPGAKAVLAEATLRADNDHQTQLGHLISALQPHGFHLAAICEQAAFGNRLEFFNALFVRA